MKNRFVLLISIISIFVGTGFTTLDQEQYLKAYQAYIDAMKAQEWAVAETQAEMALNLAIEAEAGPKSIASLAQNYTNLVIVTKPAKAVVSANKALELGRQGYGLDSARLTELQLYSSYATYAERPHKKKLNKSVVEAFERIGEEKGPLNDNVFTIGLTFIGNSLAEQQGEFADPVAHALLKQSADSDNVSKPVRARLFAYYGISKTQLLFTHRDSCGIDVEGAKGRQATKECVETATDASILFRNGMTLFPPQKDIHTIDKTLGDLHAWDRLATSVIGSLAEEMDESQTYMGWEMPDEKAIALFQHIDPETGQDLECKDLVFVDQPDPNYPRRAERKGLNAAVIMGYSFDETGAVADLNVIAEIPSRLFSDGVMEAVQDWKVDVEGVPAPCLKNRTSAFSFAIQWKQ